MLNKVMIKFKEEQLGYEEKMDLLTEGICKGIFPISIIKNQEGITGFYFTSGYKRISDCGLLGADKILTVVENHIGYGGVQSISDISRGVHNGYEYSLHKRRF